MGGLDYDAIVVGCGHNGLVSAFYLARAGLNVLALEQAPKVGGAATTDELIPGFSFSTCAHSFVLFHPQILDDMKLVERGLRVFQRDPPQFHPFANGDYLFTWADMKQTQESIARIAPRDAKAYPNYLELWAQAADLFDPYLLTDPPTLGEFLGSAEGTSHEPLAQLLIGGTKRQLLDDWFESPRVKASLGTTFDGGYTDSAGGLLYFAFASALSTRLGQRGLIGFPQGGMGAVTQKLKQAVEDTGAAVRTSTAVARIHVSNGRTAGVILADGTLITARAVVSNADPYRTLNQLVPAEHLPDEFLRDAHRLKMAAGYLKLHCATSGLPDWTALPGDGPQHGANVRLCESLDQIDHAWRHAQTGTMARKPVIGVVCPSVYDRSLTPAGHHAISIWVEYAPVGLLPRQWETQRQQITDSLIAQVARYAPNFPDIVIDSFLHGPPEIEARAGITHGNMHHVDMTIDQMLGDRPLPECSAYRTPLDGLYLCGSGCHPGGGVTGVPGHNSARAVIRDLNAAPKATSGQARVTIPNTRSARSDGMRGRSQ